MSYTEPPTVTFFNERYLMATAKVESLSEAERWAMMNEIIEADLVDPNTKVIEEAGNARQALIAHVAIDPEALSHCSPKSLRAISMALRTRVSHDGHPSPFWQ
jgi:hypothetical protein